MPIVRLSRDKRGLDTVYLIDTGTDGRKARTRVLYFWTAPPGLRVGREAFDEARRREIEDAYPDIRFAWDDLLKSLELARQQVPVPGALPRREAWRERRVARGRQRPADASSSDEGRPESNGEGPAGEARADAAAEIAPAEPSTAGPPPAAAVDAPSEEPARPAGRPSRGRRRRRRAGADAPSPSADL